MSTLLEITGDDIAALKDDDLRTLIGLLCEADYRSYGLPTKGITWGGHQDAKDGGLDVAVHNTASPPARSYVPRSNTGFQVKKTSMPKAKIKKEMRPKGVLRSSIIALIKNKGAYVIISSGEFATDSALSDRKEAMRDTVMDEANHDDLYLDFLDRGRVASWVRNHVSLAVWVRHKIGSPKNGWKPYGNWVDVPRGLKDEYLLDDRLRLRNLVNPRDKNQFVTEGLEKIRAILAGPGASVRLTGLSGVGKTRFVQALFDSRIGKLPLEPSQAIYTDMSVDPDPNPVAMVNHLINDESLAVLIVDNCSPVLHRHLTQACSNARTVSVITVEYDIRDDIPEQKTSVFRLEPATNKLIERLISNRFPCIVQANVRRIAKFSGGNARIAIALANTAHGEALYRLRDEELFKRLFWQRHEQDENLLVSAQACALTYSFQGEGATSEDSELRFLGSLVGKSGEDIYRHVTALKKRGLVQSKSVWRAVLPQAIANRLAEQALEDIPKDILVNSFLNSPSKRLLKSFARRLSYLHDCKTAVAIVEPWLETGGWIGKSIHELSNHNADVLENIAPVSPTATLSAIERTANSSVGAVFMSKKNARRKMFVELLRHLAYEPGLFERSVNLIVQFALAKDQNESDDSILNALQSRFYIYSSGTHASAEARATIIDNLLASKKAARRELGFLLLEAALDAWQSSTSHEFEFGSRSRDFAKTKKDITHWFNLFIEVCTNLATLNRHPANRARKLLANNLRGLWTKGEMYAAIEGSVERLLEQGAWNEGWNAVWDIIRYDSRSFDGKTKERLLFLEKRLKPQDLLERARTLVFSDQRGRFVFKNNFDNDKSGSTGNHMNDEADRKIGAEVARNPNAFRKLLPALVSKNNSRLYNFGQGLAEGCADKVELLDALLNAFEKTALPHYQHQINVILGFLSHAAKADSAFYNTTLDELISNDVMAEWFPILQTETASTIDQRGVERLNEALELGKAPIRTYRYLAIERVHKSINDENMVSLLEKILNKDKGFDVAVKILQVRFYGNNKVSGKYAKALTDIARKTLMMYPFDQRRRHRSSKDYALANIAARSLGVPDGTVAASELAKKLADAIFAHKTYTFYHVQLLNKLAEIQPKIFLDEFLGRENVGQSRLAHSFIRYFTRHVNPVTKISDDTIITWCEEDPSSRYVTAIPAINAFEKSSKTGKYEWRPIVDTILSRAPEPEKIVAQLSRVLRTLSMISLTADILEKRAVLLVNLFEHENAKIGWLAKRYYEILEREIASKRKIEGEYDRKRSEGFE